MVKSKIALVTGANKGVGYGIVRQLLLQSPSPLLVYLTSRDESRGRAALERLSAESDIAPKLVANGGEHELVWHPLDISDGRAIEAATSFIAARHGGHLDILINNAGIATKGDTFNVAVARETIAGNYAATLRVCLAFMPLLRPSGDGTDRGGRIVNVSSMAGKLTRLSDPLKARFRDPEATVDDITRLMDEFVASIHTSSASSSSSSSSSASDGHGDGGDKGRSEPGEGWPRAAYAVSKMGVTAVTRVLARENPQVAVHAVCPGYVNTDMTSGKGVKTIDQGALTPVHVALVDLNGCTGEFWEDCAISPW